MSKDYKDILTQPAVITSAVGVTAFCGGLGLGYLIALNKDKIISKFREPVYVIDVRIDEPELIEPEVIDPRELYPPPDPELIEVDEVKVERLEELVDKYGKASGHEIFRTEQHGYSEEPKIVNVFAHSSDSWDYETEISSRTKAKPYVIHKDEFWANDMEFAQATLTYFSGDNIMVDEKDTPVYNYSSVVGELKFGHGSQDTNVFYVRNEKNHCDYEILFDSGSYSVEILGLELEQEDEKELDKFRPDD